jgi:hypothetical protein
VNSLENNTTTLNVFSAPRFSKIVKDPKSKSDSDSEQKGSKKLPNEKDTIKNKKLKYLFGV